MTFLGNYSNGGNCLLGNENIIFLNLIQPSGAELSLPLTRLGMSLLDTQLGLSAMLNTRTVGWGESLQLVMLGVLL